MEVGSPEWIEASLAKLDDLEQQRSEHEAALESANDPLSLKEHNGALERLDAEIKALYAQLEAFDDEDDEDDEDGEGEAVAEAEAEAEVSGGDGSKPQPFAAAEVPGGTQNDEVASTSSPASSASPDTSASPFGSSGAGSGGDGGFDAPAPVSFDDDLKPHGGGGKWVFLGLVLAGGLGVGGFFLWKNMEAQKQKDVKPTTAEEIKIEAAAIPDDTEAPNAVKGGDATISPTANGNPTAHSSGSGGSGGSSKKVEKSKKPIDLKGSGGDPLGGSDPLR